MQIVCQVENIHLVVSYLSAVVQRRNLFYHLHKHLSTIKSYFFYRNLFFYEIQHFSRFNQRLR